MIAQGFELLACGADGITGKKESIDFAEVLLAIREAVVPFTFCAGVGNSLTTAFMVLKYAKSKQKNRLCYWDGSVFDVFN